MYDLITIFEDRKVKLQLTHEQEQDILSLKSDVLGSQYLSLQADGTLNMQHYVGFIARNNTRIQILPKIYDESETTENIEEEANEAAHLLFKLLSYSGFINIKEIPEPQKVAKYNNDILEIFISIFINRFINLFISDAYRKYERIEDNMQFIKGKILFSESIKKNAFTGHMHYVEYEEFTVNTVLNKIFKTIILRLLHDTKNSENTKKLKLALLYLESVDTIKLSHGLFESIKFNRLNLKYEPVFKLAKLFYYNCQPGFKEGDENTFTFLIPLNKLFEYFIYKVLYACDLLIQGDKCGVEYQKPQQYLAQYDGKGIFTLIPDIAVMQRDKALVILDAKYKNPFYQEEISVSQSDIYQMLAYGVHYNCKKIFLIYPIFKGKKRNIEPVKFVIKTALGNIIINVVQIDILEKDVSKIKYYLECVVNNEMELDYANSI